MDYDIGSVAGNFKTNGVFARAVPFGCGHINDTFRVTCRKKTGDVNYVLQRINHDIFTDPASLMQNIVRVTAHIQNEVQSQGGDTARQLCVIGARDGKPFYKDNSGNYWRMFNLIEKTVTKQTLESVDLAFEAAAAFGRFQKMLGSLPGPSLNETVPGFHNTPARFDALVDIIQKDPCNRAIDAKQQIDFVMKNASICGVMLGFAEKGDIPLRVTHNDTKINNVLLDEDTGKGICVIDLDTVMPGLSLYDVGDMVRTAACTAAEDERDLKKVNVNLEIYKNIARGFAAETAEFLTDTEKQQFPFAGILITFEQMIRFLTDYLAGDVYYRIHRPGQNLDRAAVQMRLVQSLMEHQGQMRKLNEKVWNV